MNNENEKTESQTINREQVVLWAMDAGFNPGFVRLNVRDFEKFADLIRRYMERDYK